jgi:gluconate 2-dehydrogenase gamma chain
LDRAEQDKLLRAFESGELDLGDVPGAVFFETLLANTIEGYFADPMYGGNRDMAAWRMIGFPGAYANYASLVDHHGLKFTHRPLSAAEVAHADGDKH